MRLRTGGDRRRPDRRRRYYIDRPLQGRFAILFLALGLLVGLGTGGAVWFLSSTELEKQIFRSHLTTTGPWDVLFPILVRSLLVSVGALLLFAFAVTRSVFRTMAEELASFEEAMGRIGGGDLKTGVPEGRVSDLNETLDKVREALREKTLTLRETQERMSAEVSRSGATDLAVRGEIRRLCGAFRAAMP